MPKNVLIILPVSCYILSNEIDGDLQSEPELSWSESRVRALVHCAGSPQ